jgi:hypothetical protein
MRIVIGASYCHGAGKLALVMVIAVAAAAS